ncbi:uncharacterized protein LOC127751387 [Frankliniella occidentalis]|uniref:Uncharacterized protein LOC127751387 n=1 Tax=Frankliniella occidentalis TaxID=133901 RepID=A0A9C6XTL0_FRAOC|nr:uncharacterized protein LOC127751387 [Frankliniella occidentalis]
MFSFLADTDKELDVDSNSDSGTEHGSISISDKNDSDTTGSDSDTPLQDLARDTKKKKTDDVNIIKRGKENVLNELDQENEQKRINRKLRHEQRRNDRLLLAENSERSKGSDKQRQSISSNGEPRNHGTQRDDLAGSTETNKEQVPCSQDGPPKSQLQGNVSGASSEDIDASQPAKELKRKRKRTRVMYSKAVFDGEYYRHKTESDTVVPIRDGSSIFIHKRAMKEVKKASTATAAARRLVKAVFSDKALIECSVSGRPSNSTRSGERVIRPPLHADGVNEILDFIEHRCTKKNWGKIQETPVKRAMMDVMNEDRYFLHLQSQQQEQQSRQG